MATRPPNQASGGNADTSKPKKPRVKRPPKTKPASPPRTPPVDPLFTTAQTQAAGEYAPQVYASDRIGRSAPPWYSNYMNTARGAGTASAAVAAPIIANARTFAQNINAPSAGLDPNSPEYQKSQQAGKGIGALAEFGAQNLEGNQAADQTYFQGQATNAAATLPGVLAENARQRGAIKTQQAARASELYQQLHAQAVNEDIARRTLNLNTAKAGGYDPVTGKKLPAEPASPSEQKTQAELDFFNQHGYWPPTGPPKPKSTAVTQEQKDAAKHAKSIKTVTGNLKVRVQDITDAWARGRTVTDTVPDTSQPKNLLTGQQPTKKINRPMTREELRKALGDQYGGTWVSIMEYVRAGTPLTQQQIDYIHSSNPDARVPKEWIRGRAKPGKRYGGVGRGADTT